MGRSPQEPHEEPPGAARPPRRPRRALVVGALALAAVAALLVSLAAFGGGGGVSLNADPVEPARDAPLTAGRDANGEKVSVPEPGRPAIVTFLYTHCPDICPLTAQEISQALDQADVTTDDIDVVAISVDPKGDTPAAVQAFLERHGLTGRMRYIVGSAADLRPLWKSWLIAAQPEGAINSIHSARVVLVDREGRQVGSYAAGLPIDVGDLAADIRSLAG
jgi:protein SCO1/2